MQKREKQVAAALAAVQQYLQEEEAAALAAMEQAPAPARLQAVDPGAWALAGRMEMMSGHRMMQMRVLARIR